MAFEGTMWEIGDKPSSKNASMSIKDLKTALQSAGLGHLIIGMTEKRELVDLLDAHELQRLSSVLVNVHHERDGSVIPFCQFTGEPIGNTINSLFFLLNHLSHYAVSPCILFHAQVCLLFFSQSPHS